MYVVHQVRTLLWTKCFCCSTDCCCFLVVNLYSFVLQGLSFLEMKYHMLLSYLINLTYVVLRKCSGKMIEGDPAIGMLLALLLICDLHINICTLLTCLCISTCMLCL